MSRHTQAALARLHAVAEPLAASDDQAIGDAAADVLMATDIMAALQAMVGLTLAVEAREAAVTALARARVDDAKAVHERVRTALHETLEESGAMKVRAGFHTASVGAASAGVVVTDEAALPETYIRVKREPNKDAIRRALLAGEAVPGALLGNAKSRLTISASKKEAAL